MAFFEKFRNRQRESQEETYEGLLLSLVESALKRKERVPGENSFAIRIKAAIQKGEIRFAENFSSNEPEESIAIRLGRYEGFEERGLAVILVVRKTWVEEAVVSEDRSKKLDFLYTGLKAVLEEIGALRADGYHLLTGAECEEITQQQRLPAEN